MMHDSAQKMLLQRQKCTKRSYIRCEEPFTALSWHVD